MGGLEEVPISTRWPWCMESTASHTVLNRPGRIAVLCSMATGCHVNELSLPRLQCTALPTPCDYMYIPSQCSRFRRNPALVRVVGWSTSGRGLAKPFVRPVC